MTSLPWMSSHARTQRSHRMQASWSTLMTGFEESVPRPEPHGRSVVSRARPKPSRQVRAACCRPSWSAWGPRRVGLVGDQQLGEGRPAALQLGGGGLDRPCRPRTGAHRRRRTPGRRCRRRTSGTRRRGRSARCGTAPGYRRRPAWRRRRSSCPPERSPERPSISSVTVRTAVVGSSTAVIRAPLIERMCVHNSSWPDTGDVAGDRFRRGQDRPSRSLLQQQTGQVGGVGPALSVEPAGS